MEEKELELAERFAEQERDNRIQASRVALAAQHDDSFDGKHCIDCPVEIPQARLDMKRVRCTVCETKVERRKKLFGGR